MMIINTCNKKEEEDEETRGKRERENKKKTWEKGNEVIHRLRKERRSWLCKCRAQGGTRMNRGCYAG